MVKPMASAEKMSAPKKKSKNDALSANLYKLSKGGQMK
jgi:hypothetical protein